MTPTTSDTQLEVMLPVGDLHARAVYAESGERLGLVRGVRTDPAGHVTALVVREGWILGREHDLPAGGMRIDHGDVVIPRSASAAMVEHELEITPLRPVAHDAEQSARPMPIFVQGRERHLVRFGGLDVSGALLGALVALAALAMLGGLLAAGFDVGRARFDTGATDFGGATTAVGLLGIGVAALFGGWAAGRSARFDGIANGLLAATIMLGLGVASAGLGRWLGVEYDRVAALDLPHIASDGASPTGLLAVLAALVVLLVCAALGGMLGEAWHRRADRAMLDVVPTSESHGHRWREQHRPRW